MAEQHGKPVAPFDQFEEARRSLHLLGRQGVTLIAIAALDMAMWDALAKALGSPLVVALGGTVGPVRSYNTNGLWLVPIERIAVEASALVAEVDFKALKIRLGRESVTDDLKAIAEVRRAVGDDILLMSDFNQGAPRRIATCPTWNGSAASPAGCDPRPSPAPQICGFRPIFIPNFPPI